MCAHPSTKYKHFYLYIGWGFSHHANTSYEVVLRADVDLGVLENFSNTSFKRAAKTECFWVFLCGVVPSTSAYIYYKKYKHLYIILGGVFPITPIIPYYNIKNTSRASKTECLLGVFWCGGCSQHIHNTYITIIQHLYIYTGWGFSHHPNNTIL